MGRDARPATSGGSRRSPATTGSATAELALFHPLKFMLASPAEDADEIIARLGPEVWVEDKYDGIRAQLHKHGTDGPALLARPPRHQRPVPGGRRRRRATLPWDGILDGEILAWRDGVVLPFIALQARLGRKAPSAAIRAEVPVIFVAFDVLGARRRATARPVEPLLRRAADRAAATGSTRSTCRSPSDGGRFARSHLVVGRPTSTRSRPPSPRRAPGATRA